MTSLSVDNMRNCALTIPTSVFDLRLYDFGVQRVSISGTESITHLKVPNKTITTTPCPELQWQGDTLSDEALPFPINDVTTHSVTTITATTSIQASGFRHC